MQHVEVQLEDDLTGGPAEETVRFAVDGTDYELDLNARNAADLRRRFAAFVQSARVARPRRPSHGRTRTAAVRERSRQMRAWAEQQGITIADRGRLPRQVIQEYEEAHGGDQTGKRGTARTISRRPAARSRTTAKTLGRTKRSPRRQPER
jgi:hypothetical protein